jgi:glutamate synthase domain-containing protein 3
LKRIECASEEKSYDDIFDPVSEAIHLWDFENLRWFVQEIKRVSSLSDDKREWGIDLLSLLYDRKYACGEKKRSVVLQIILAAIIDILSAAPAIDFRGPGRFRRIDWNTRHALRPPEGEESTLIIFSRDFPPEGDECDSRLAVNAYQLGWKRFFIYGLKGQRFTGCGFGPGTDGMKMDIFGSSGDYLASGIDGMEIFLHGSGQDQLGQIMKRGKLVVFGDVGQAFMYGAKGGEVYVMGNAAGRPLINAAGGPRVIINGTCLDFLAESFMAGDPFKGGGFVILNGIEFDENDRAIDQDSPYPGSNLFSLASGGALYVRDPHRKIISEQLNGGEFADLTQEDWDLILPYLEANERYFGISIQKDLLTIEGVQREPHEVYRKVRAVKLAVLASETIPE